MFLVSSKESKRIFETRILIFTFSERSSSLQHASNVAPVVITSSTTTIDTPLLFGVHTTTSPTNGSNISASLVTEYALTFPDACTTGEMRPFGLKYHQGKGYLGVVCDASLSLDSLDLMAYVYSFDPENVSAGLTKVLEWLE